MLTTSQKPGVGKANCPAVEPSVELNTVDATVPLVRSRREAVTFAAPVSPSSTAHVKPVGSLGHAASLTVERTRGPVVSSAAPPMIVKPGVTRSTVWLEVVIPGEVMTVRTGP